MALTERQIERGIKFGGWMLTPLDERNWELCHWHVAKATGRNRGGTEPQWNRLGRFYSCGTFGNALAYAADCDLKAELDGIADIMAALDRYEQILTAHRRECAASFAGVVA